MGFDTGRTIGVYPSSSWTIVDSEDVLNKYLLKTNMPVVPSQYWSIAHGTSPGEVVRDEEGMQTMRQLGLNMAFMIKSIRLGLHQFGSPKIQEELTETHYIR